MKGLLFLVGMGAGGFAGFMLGHLDGRRAAYKYELRRFIAITKRVRVVLAEAEDLRRRHGTPR